MHHHYSKYVINMNELFLDTVTTSSFDYLPVEIIGEIKNYLGKQDKYIFDYVMSAKLPHVDKIYDKSISLADISLYEDYEHDNTYDEEYSCDDYDFLNDEEVCDYDFLDEIYMMND